MTGRRKLAIGGAIAATVTAIAWWWPADRAAAPAAGRGLAVGEQRSYDLTWDGTSVADASSLPGQAEAYRGEVRLRARLVVRGLGRDGDRALIGYRLEHVDGASYRVLGQDILAGIDPTVGELVAVIGPDGGLRELRPDPAAAPAADLMMRAVVQQSVVTLGGGDAWDAVEPGPVGVAQMAYRRDAAGALTRTRTGYLTLSALPGACPTCQERLEGSAAIAVDRSGVVRELDDRLRLVVEQDGATRLAVESRFTLRASSVVARSRAAPALDGRPVVAAAGAGLEPGDDLGRARDWSLGRIGDTIVRFLATGATPGETTWMHGVAAYLRVHPEACTELLRLFAAPGLPASGRDLIASMLVAAGTPAAQAALRDGVDWLAQDQGDDAAARVLPRVALLTEPTASTASWLAELRDDRGDRAATASAATFALGAAIGQLDDPAVAARHAAALADELDHATADTQRVELLGALGNAGRAEDAAVIAARADDPAPEVRRQVARSLRKLDDSAATPPLTALAGDAVRSVRELALEMLLERRLDAAAVDRAAVAAVAAGARGDELGPVIRLLSSRVADPGVAARLRSLLALVDGQPDLRALIEHALAS